MRAARLLSCIEIRVARMSMTLLICNQKGNKKKIYIYIYIYIYKRKKRIRSEGEGEKEIVRRERK
ncbi:hypothetical protein Scep_007343 [Stephania cephalantha]|uniref:Uncharacterized protein n=1 Tax=Stephania cephalantha TaxID=152367 RepID=A0AAP0PPY1_9MAGN